MANEGSPANPSLSGAQILAKLLALGALGAAFTDSAFAIVGSGDATKIARFEVDGLTTATTRVYTLPDASIVVSGSASALTSGRVPFATTGGLLLDSSALTFNGAALTVGANTVTSGFVNFNGPASVQRAFQFQSAGVNLWIIGTSGTESGANAGASLNFDARSDAGAFIDTPLSISRAAGTAIAFARPLTCSSTTDASAIGTASVVLTGGLSVAKAMYLAGPLNVVTSNNAQFILSTSTNGNQRSITFKDTAGSKYNWLVGAQITVSDAWEIIPSTAAGGSTFSTPALYVAAATGLVTIGAGGLTVNALTNVVQTALGTQTFIANHNATGASTVSAATFQAGNSITTQTTAGVLDVILGAIETSTDIFLRCRSNGSNKILFFGDGSASYTGAMSITSATDSTSLATGAFICSGGGTFGKRLTLDGATGKTLRIANGVANAAVGVTFGAVGPTGSTAGNQQGWMRVDINGTDRYIPYW